MTNLTIDELIKQAMKSGDKAALTGFRSVKSKILLEKTKETKTTASDEELLLTAAAKEVREREETIKIYPDQTNPIVVENIAILNSLKFILPKMLSESEQQTVIDGLIKSTAASSIKDLNKITSMLQSEYKGRVDMKTAVAYIRSKLN